MTGHHHCFKQQGGKDIIKRWWHLASYTFNIKKALDSFPICQAYITASINGGNWKIMQIKPRFNMPQRRGEHATQRPIFTLKLQVTVPTCHSHKDSKKHPTNTSRIHHDLYSRVSRNGGTLFAQTSGDNTNPLKM